MNRALCFDAVRRAMAWMTALPAWRAPDDQVDVWAYLLDGYIVAVASTPEEARRLAIVRHAEQWLTTDDKDAGDISAWMDGLDDDAALVRFVVSARRLRDMARDTAYAEALVDIALMVGAGTPDATTIEGML